MELRDKLEEEGKTEDDDIDEECDKLREKLVNEMGKGKSGAKGGRTKSYQVHELAEAKARESEKLRRALGLKADVVKEGEEAEHPMARQDRRKREADLDRVKREEQGLSRDRDWDGDEDRSRRR